MWFARGLLLLLSGGVFVAAMIGYLIGHQPQRAPADPTTVTTIGGPR